MERGVIKALAAESSGNVTVAAASFAIAGCPFPPRDDFAAADAAQTLVPPCGGPTDDRSQLSL